MASMVPRDHSEVDTKDFKINKLVLLYQRGEWLSASSATRKARSLGKVKRLAQCPMACFDRENTGLLICSAVAAIPC